MIYISLSLRGIGFMRLLRIFLSLAFLFILFTNFSGTQEEHAQGDEKSTPSRKFQLAYTTSTDSNEITPIDLQTGTAGKPIPFKHHPGVIAVHPDTQIAYVLQNGSNEIIPVELLTGKVLPAISLEMAPTNMLFSKDGKKAYISYERTNLIESLELESGSTTTLAELKTVPSAIALGTDGKTLFVSSKGSKEITPIDIPSSTIHASIVLSDIPKAIAVTFDGQLAAIGKNSSNAISLYDLKTGKFNGSLGIDSRSNDSHKIQNIHLSPDNKTGYLTLENSNEIVSVDLATHHHDAAEINHNIKNIAVYPKQELVATFLKNIAPAGQTSHFDASPTKPFNGKIINYHWDFGDGHKATTESPRVAHTYQHSDKFEVTLTVKESMANFPLENLGHELIDKTSPLAATTTASIKVPKKSSLTAEQPLTSNNKLGDPPTLFSTTSTTLDSSSQPSVFGESVTFSSTVSSVVGPDIPTGTVDFVDTILGTIGTGTLNGSGIATYTTSSLAVGTYSLSANYSGDSNFDPSSSSPPQFSQTVNQALTSVSLTGTPNPSIFGENVTITATISVISPGAGTPTGTVTFKNGPTTIGTGTISGGQASISSSALPPGVYSITATYEGDTNFLTSTSPTWTQTVNQATTTTSVVTSLTPSPFGNSVTFTATVAVATGAGTPTGTVTFRDGSTVLGTQALTGSTAALSTSALAVGSHNIVATYNGDANFTLSNSTPLTQVINQGTTATALTSSINPSTYGQSTTFTATVTISAGAGTPTGSVTFRDGLTTLGTTTINGSGVATLPVSNLSVGSHSITAEYSGDTNFATSTSTPLTQTVNQATPTNIVTSSLSPSNFGDQVTFTATVSAPTSLGLPTGSVNFYNGATLIGTGTLSAVGPNTATATFAISTLNAGTLPITAQYGGDGNFVAVTSPVFSQVVNPVSTTGIIVFSNSQNPSTFGQNVILRATVTGSTTSPPFPPTGTITFYDGATPIGTGTVTTVPGNPRSGTASLSISTLTIGAHTITAQYSGDVNYPPSALSAPMTQNVIQSNTKSVVTTTLTPTVFGQNATFNVTVTPVSPGMGTPSGVVAFYDGATFLGNSSALVAGINSSTATFSTNVLTLGSHIISGVYVGDTNFTTSSAPAITQTVIKANTNTVITTSSSSPPGFNFGDYVTFTASVTAAAPGSGTPTGTVRFFDGATLIGTGTLSGGTATVTTVTLYPSPPPHSITAVYVGDTNFNTSTSPVFSQNINSTLPTTTTVTSSRNSSPDGAAVTYFARVVANPGPGQGVPGIPTGTVTFTDTTTGLVLGTSTLNALGIASIVEPGANLPFVPPAPDIHQIQAVYNGQTAVFDPSTSALFDQYVVPRDTTTTLTASTSTPDHNGQASVTLVATVDVVGGSPAHPTDLATTVSFYQAGLFLGTVPIQADGTATLNPNNLHFGSGPFIAVYSGNTTEFAMSTSNPITLQIQQTDMLNTNTVVSTSQASTVFCQPIVFTAVVTETEGFYTPTGTVTFFEDNTSVGTAILDDDGIATLTVTDLPVGIHRITASYNSDSNYAFSFGNTIIQTVTPNTTSTTLSIIPNLASTPYGENLILSATVATTTSYNAVPTGSVIFTCGTTTIATVPLDSSGIAITQISTIAVGAYTIVATYVPDPCFLASSATRAHSIAKINPQTSLTPIPNPSTYGDPITITATVNSPSGTPTGSVTFYNGSTNLGTVFLEGGTATLRTASPPAGFAIFSAQYSGDDNFLAIMTESVLQTINKADSSTCLVSYTTNPSQYGQLVSLSATVSSDVPSSLPGLTGTVRFTNGSTLLGIVPVNDCNTAELETTNLVLGSSNNIIATYSGDSNFTDSVSSALNRTVIQSGTNTTVTSITSSPNPPTFGTLATVNVTVEAISPGSGIPSGTVTGYYGTTILGTGTLVNGVASFSTSVLPAGVQTIVVKYSGDTNFTASQRVATQTVLAATTTTTLTSSANPSVFGQAVTFNVAVTSAQGTPTGTVAFMDGTTTLSTQTLNASGTATFTISSLNVATHPIRAVYSGSTNLASSTSAVVNQVVNKDSSVTFMMSTPNPSTYGNTTVFIASVGAAPPGSGMPTGTVTFRNGATVIGSSPVTPSGNASLEITTSLPASTTPYAITATYNGDGNFNTSVAALSQTIDKTATNITATYSPNPANFGQAVTLNVNVTPISGVGVPTGTVTAFYGSQVVGSGTLLSNGTVSILTNNLPTGTLGIVLQYQGDTNFLSSSIPLTQTVSVSASTTALTSSANPSLIGQPVTFTATVTSPSSSTVVPTGTITFYDGTTALETLALNSFGTITYTTSSLSRATHPITAVYSGDVNNGPSTSTILNQVVNQGTTTSIVSSILNPSVYGETVTLRATVTATSPSQGLPTGTVTFRNGGVPIPGGVITLNRNGEAIFNVSSLPVGTDLISVVYAGDTNFTTSTSANLSQIVARAPTISSVTSATNPSTFGSSVAISGTVTPLNNGSTTLPTGTTVTAFYGATAVGSGTLNASGQYAFSISGLPAGVSAIEVKYPGDANFLPSTITLTQSVGSDTSTISIASSPNPSTFGQAVTFTNTVTLGSAQPATGTVTYYDGPSAIGTVNAGQPLVISTLAIGTHPITAVYTGPSGVASATSNTVNQVVNQSSTTTTLSSILNPSVYGESVTFSAVVNRTGSGLPSGTVTFRNGGIPIPGGVVSLNSNGEAIFTISTLPVGTSSITAVYSGDANYTTSTSTILSQVVARAPTITNVTSATNPSTFNSPVTITGTVTPLNNGSVTLPSGTTVTAFYGATAVGSGTINASGQYSFAISGLPAGTLAIEVKYPGDANFLPSTITLTQTVTADTSTLVIGSSPNPSTFGQTVTFTNAVTLGSAQPATGTVTYYDGTRAIGTVNVGTSLTISNLMPGTHAITAVYSGSANAASATSNSINQIVNQSGTTTAVVTNLNPSVYGNTVTFTATVTHPNPGTPTGYVTFLDGATVLGTGELSPAGQAIFSTAILSAGSHSITAVYSGDVNFASSTSPALTQVVNLVPASGTTTTIVSSVPNPSVFGQNVNFFANVTSPNGNPTGTVTFYDGATALSTVPLFDGFAVMAINSLAPGNHNITAVYNGNSNFSPSLPSSIYVQQVNPVTVTNTTVTTLTSLNNPSNFGDPVTFNVQVTSAVIPPPYPSGFVTLFTGSIPMVTLPLNSTGFATYTTSTLPAGNLQIVALYSGDADFSASTDVISQIVNAIATTTALTSTPNPSDFMEPVTFTATVSSGPGNPVPTGSVSFFNGPLLMETVILNSSGVAAFMTSNLTTGSHLITATYNADVSFAASSDSLTQLVETESTMTVILSSSSNPSNVGSSVTFIANVTAPNGMPTGLVTFYDGATPIGTSVLFNGLAFLTTSSLTTGSHSITASYAGSTDFDPSTSPPFTQQVIDGTAILQPARGFCGCPLITNFLNRSYCCAVLKWSPPGVGAEPEFYSIYRDPGLTDLVATISACAPLTYTDPNLKKNVNYTYYLVAGTQNGLSSYVTVTVGPDSTNCCSIK